MIRKIIIIVILFLSMHGVEYVAPYLNTQFLKEFQLNGGVHLGLANHSALSLGFVIRPYYKEYLYDGGSEICAILGLSECTLILGEIMFGPRVGYFYSYHFPATTILRLVTLRGGLSVVALTAQNSGTEVEEQGFILVVPEIGIDIYPTDNSFAFTIGYQYKLFYRDRFPHFIVLGIRFFV